MHSVNFKVSKINLQKKHPEQKLDKMLVIKSEPNIYLVICIIIHTLTIKNNLIMFRTLTKF